MDGCSGRDITFSAANILMLEMNENKRTLKILNCYLVGGGSLVVS